MSAYREYIERMNDLERGVPPENLHTYSKYPEIEKAASEVVDDIESPEHFLRDEFANAVTWLSIAVGTACLASFIAYLFWSHHG